MNITTINQLVSVNISLDRDEAIAALKNPAELQRKLREALGDVAVGATVRKNGRRPKGRTVKVSGTGRRSTTWIICHVCERRFKTSGRYNRHVLKNHPSTVIPADD